MGLSTWASSESTWAATPRMSASRASDPLSRFKGPRELNATTVTYIGRIFTGKESGDQIGGPIRTVAMAGGVTKSAIDEGGGAQVETINIAASLLQLVAYVSVAVGFLNLLPIPVLDGGHLLFYGYEAVARKPLKARVQEVGYQVGLALLLGLVLFATWNDLTRLNVFKFLGGLVS